MVQENASISIPDLSRVRSSSLAIPYRSPKWGPVIENMAAETTSSKWISTPDLFTNHLEISLRRREDKKRYALSMIIRA